MQLECILQGNMAHLSKLPKGIKICKTQIEQWISNNVFEQTKRRMFLACFNLYSFHLGKFEAWNLSQSCLAESMRQALIQSCSCFDIRMFVVVLALPSLAELQSLPYLQEWMQGHVNTFLILPSIFRRPSSPLLVQPSQTELQFVEIASQTTETQNWG